MLHAASFSRAEPPANPASFGALQELDLGYRLCNRIAGSPKAASIVGGYPTCF